MTTLRRFGPARWLHLIVETKARELDSKVLLACCAAERGHAVLVGPKMAFQNRLNQLPPGLLFHKSISVNKLSRFKRLSARGYRIAVSDEETFSIYSQPEYWCATRASKETFAMTRLYCTWGERQREILTGHYPEYGERICTTGTPRADLWMPPLNALYRAEAAAYKKRFGPYIFMPSNFGGVTHSQGPDFVIQQAEAFGILRNHADLNRLQGQLDHNRTVLDAFVVALKALRDAFPDHALIVRPHPADDHSFWHRTLEGLPGCHVVYKGAVTPWLLGADAIFHNGCSSGVEAYIMGKQSVSYNPNWDDRYEKFFQSHASTIVTDLNSLIATIGAVIGGCHEDAVDADFVGHHLLTVPGSLASDRVADAIAELDWPARTLDLSWTNPAVLRAAPRLGRDALTRRARLLLDRPAERHRKWPDGIHDADFSRPLAIFQEQLRRFSGIAIRRLTSDGLYLVTSE